VPNKKKTRPPGRPKKVGARRHLVAFRVSDEILAVLMRRAKKAKISPNEAARAIVMDVVKADTRRSDT